MAGLKLNHIYKVYENGTKAVSDFNMEIKDKEFIVFVGPSGCGKSTTLRMIAGLEDITAGDLFIDDKLVNDLEPKDRKVTMVFQNYALYPHMTVYENMSYGLKIAKVNKAEIDRRVHEAAKILDIEEYLQKKPKEMSGGQRQRVALGRAIVRNPKVFLLDEPLSNLDAKLRATMRTEISKLHNRLQTTFIYVTHDQTEAMTMGTRIVVMKKGLIQQIDTPKNLYTYPINKFVAGFIGSPQMNFYNVKVDGNKISFTDGNSMVLNDEMADKLRNYKEVILGIRGEDIKFDPQNLDIFKENKQRAVIDNTEIMGNENNLYFEFGGSSSVARVSKYEVSDVGEEIEFVFVPHRMHFFDKVTEDAITL